MTESCTMERSPNKHTEWFDKLDVFLADEGMILDGLKKAVDENGMTAEQAEENYRAYHRTRAPLVAPTEETPST